MVPLALLWLGVSAAPSEQAEAGAEARLAIEAAYRTLRTDALADRRAALADRFSPMRFEDALGRPQAVGPAALDRLIEHERENASFAIRDCARYLGRGPRHGVAVRVDVTYGSDERFEDLWFRGRDRAWRMVRRRDGARRFANALVSDVAAVLAEGSAAAVAVDPRADRPVSVDLAALPLEAALRRLAEAAEAAYRLENGTHRIVPPGTDASENRIDWAPMIADGPNEPIEARYGWMVERIVHGEGTALRREIGTGVDADAFVATVRAFPRWTVVAFAYVGKDVEAVVAHRDGDDRERRFRDLWRWDGEAWRWVSRTPALPNAGLRFYDARVDDVLRAFFVHHGQAATIGPSVRGRVTIDLEGDDFRAGLGRLLRAADLTYRIVDGGYVVRPLHDGPNGASRTFGSTELRLNDRME